MTGKNLPKTLGLDLTDVKAATEFKTFKAEGFVEVAVISAENAASSGKVYDQSGQHDPTKEKVRRYQQVLELSPLKRPGDPSSAETTIKLKKYLQLPNVAEGSIEPEDLEAEKTVRGEITKTLVKTLQCFFDADEIPASPRKEPNGKWSYRGEDLEPKDIEAAKADRITTGMQIAYKLWNDPDRWLTPRKTAFAKIRQKVGNDNVSRPEIHFFTNKLPDGAELLPYADWFKT